VTSVHGFRYFIWVIKRRRSSSEILMKPDELTTALAAAPIAARLVAES